MSSHCYLPGALVPDYLRSGAGFALTGGPFFFANPSSIMIYVLGGLAALFFLYGARTFIRQMTRFELTDGGLAARGPLGATVRWDELQRMQVRYFSTRRDRTEGWMQLKLGAASGSLRIDSEVSEFATIAAQATRAAERRGLDLSEATRANLATLDIDLADPPGEAPAGP